MMDVNPGRKNGAYDLVILGGGSAAFAAAIRASELGKRAVMVERGTIGGTCVNVGCVPSKHLLALGEHLVKLQRSPFRSLRVEKVSFDFLQAMQQKDEVVLALRKQKYSDVISALEGADLINGTATFRSRDEILVDGRRISGKAFLIATGSSPWNPPIPGLEEAGYWTNVEALSPHRRPDSLIVIGGRALALEFAQMYAHFGTEVTLLQRSARIIPNEEPECSEALREILEEDGVTIHTRVALQEIKRQGDQKAVVARIRGRVEEFAADEILVATGRRPNTQGLNLESVGVKLGENGEVKVDEEMRTSVPHIFAAGDVTGGQMLETTAAKEGFIAAENALKDGHLKMDPPEHVPRAIFTSPEFAAVGHTEETFAAITGVCACRTIPVELVPKAQVVGDTRGVIKMTIDPRDKRIVGVQMVAPFAADLIHEAALAVKHRITIDDLIDLVHVFPTYSEALKLAAQSFYRDVSKLSCCIQ